MLRHAASAAVRGCFVIVLVAAAVLAVPASRSALLASYGRFLAADDPVQPADIIVVAIDADGAGVLEAADLVPTGIATRVAIFPDPPDAGIYLPLPRLGV